MQSYSSHVRPSSHCVDASRVIIGGQLTPLPEVVAPNVVTLPGDIGAKLKREFWKRHDSTSDWQGKHAAQDWLFAEVEEYTKEKIGLAFDEHEIRSRAARWAELCTKMQSIEVMQDFARSVGVNPPEVKKHVTRVGVARRMACARWWRRQIRKTYTRRAESHLRASGFVHRRRQVYASDRAVLHKRHRTQATTAMLKDMLAVSDHGDQLELFDVVSKSQANPALRRAELMVRARGFEEIAEMACHVAEFVTLTCPSAFHRTLDNGTKNPRWEGFNPREGQQWLCRMWARARSAIKRQNAFFYGFRIAEPHHDGTAHWHLLLFATPGNIEKVRDVLRAMWNSEYAEEPGAKEYRTKFVPIIREKGSAAGYIAKYVAKNIDGFQVGDDLDAEKPAIETAERVQAWASAHGIRQFQQIGGPAVSVWRELRRIRNPIRSNEAIEAARQAADSGEWAAFVAAIGGIDRGRDSAVKLWLERTGELNQYDEPRAPQIAGVVSSTGRTRTREKVWRIERKDRQGSPLLPVASGAARHDSPAGLSSRSSSSLGPVSITVRGPRNMPAGGVAGNSENTHVRGPPWIN